MPPSLAVPVAPQPRLCVIGAGALGSALLDRLRQLGFRSVLVVDPDGVEERNLPLSPLLFRALAHAASAQEYTRTPSRNKAVLLAAASQALDGLPWRSAAREIADVGWQTLRACDVLCCCTDSVLSRVETAWIARSLRRPMLDGGVFGQGIRGGRVSTFPPAVTAACFLCGLAEDRRASVLSYAASGSLGCQAPETVPAMTGAHATLNAVADALLAQLLRWQEFSASTARSTRLAEAGKGGWKAEAIELSRSTTCPWHDDRVGVLRALPWNAAIRPALQSGARELVLNWPVCTEARCDGCGRRSRPMQRVASVRRSLCPECGQQQQQPLRSIHRIQHNDTYSDLSPRQLGMPRRHLYWLR